MSAACRARQNSTSLSFWLLGGHFPFYFSLTQPPFNHLSLPVILASRICLPVSIFLFSSAKKKWCLWGAAWRSHQLLDTWANIQQVTGLKIEFLPSAQWLWLFRRPLFKSVDWRLLPNRTAAFCNGSVEQRTELGLSTRYFGTGGGGVLLKYRWLPLGVSKT